MSNLNHYDYVVIGAGSGGLVSSIGLKKIGKNVALVSQDIGGECTNSGCIPSKTLIHLAKQNTPPDKIFKTIQTQIKNTRDHEKSLLEELKLPYIEGKATFLDKNSISINSKTIKFKKAIISTGSSPKTINIPNYPKDKILTNNEIFNLKALPKSILIIGGGPIGIEIASALSKLGVEITISTRSKMLSKENEDLVSEIEKKLIQNNVKIFKYSREYKYNQTENTISFYSQEKKIEFKSPEYIFLAIGRTPNTDLKLKLANIEYNKNGILVNNSFKTTNKNIYAIGDCINHPKFTHLAEYQAKFIIKKQILPWSRQSTPIIPSVTFCDPLIARTGDTQENKLVKKFSIDLTESDRAKIDKVEIAQANIYINMLNGRIVGANIIGEFSEHIINFFTLAIQKKTTAFALDQIVIPYPTLSSPMLRTLQVHFLNKFKQDITSNIKIMLKDNIVKITSILFWIIGAGLAIYYLNSINYDSKVLFDQMQALLLSPFGVFLFILIYSIRALISFSAIVLTIAGASIYGFWFGFPLIMLAANLSSAVAYFLGKNIFASISDTTSKSHGIRRKLKENTFEAVLIARLTFFPYDLLSYIAGALRVNFKKFILASILGSFPGTMAFASFGASLKNIESLDDFEFQPGFILLSIAILIISIGLSQYLKRRTTSEE